MGSFIVFTSTSSVVSPAEETENVAASVPASAVGHDRHRLRHGEVRRREGERSAAEHVDWLEPGGARDVDRHVRGGRRRQAHHERPTSALVHPEVARRDDDLLGRVVVRGSPDRPGVAHVVQRAVGTDRDVDRARVAGREVVDALHRRPGPDDRAHDPARVVVAVEEVAAIGRRGAGRVVERPAGDRAALVLRLRGAAAARRVGTGLSHRERGRRRRRGDVDRAVEARVGHAGDRDLLALAETVGRRRRERDDVAATRGAVPAAIVRVSVPFVRYLIFGGM